MRRDANHFGVTAKMIAALSLCLVALSACTTPDDNLAVLRFDPGAFGIPEMTLFSWWF